jgi:hypothetical protein
MFTPSTSRPPGAGLDVADENAPLLSRLAALTVPRVDVRHPPDSMRTKSRTNESSSPTATCAHDRGHFTDNALGAVGQESAMPRTKTKTATARDEHAAEKKNVKKAIASLHGGRVQSRKQCVASHLCRSA